MRKAVASLLLVPFFLQMAPVADAATQTIGGSGSSGTQTISGNASNGTQTIGGGQSSFGTQSIGGSSSSTGTQTIGGSSTNGTQTISGSNNSSGTQTIGGNNTSSTGTQTISSNGSFGTQTIGGSNSSNGTQTIGGTNNTSSTGTQTIGSGTSSSTGTQTIGGNTSSSTGTQTIGGNTSSSTGTQTIGGNTSSSTGTQTIGGNTSSSTGTQTIGGNTSSSTGTQTIGGNTSSSTGTQTIGGGTQTGRPSVTLLQAINITATSATLLYNGSDPDANDSLSYTVCLRNVSQNGSNVCSVTNNEYFTASNLVANSQYQWTVTVADPVGQGSTVNGPLSFNTLAQQPANQAPTISLTSLTSTNNSVTLTWSANDDSGTAGLQYDICFSNDINGVTFNCPASISGVMFYTITGLQPGTTYYATVRARDGMYTVYANNGPQGVSTSGSQTNPGNRVPSVTLNTASTTTNSANFSWTGGNVDNGETLTYRLCVDTNLNTLLQNCTSQNTNTSATRSSLSANTTYFWTVLVSDGTYNDVQAANGPQSFVTTGSGSNHAPVVTQLNPANAAITNATVTSLQWSGTDQDNDALTYSVYVKEVAQGTTVTHDELLQPVNRVISGTSQLSYNYTTQVQNSARSIYWMVVAADAQTTGESAVRFFVFQPQGTPSQLTVTMLNPANGSVQPVQGTYQLQWMGSSANPIVYDVYAMEVDQLSPVQNFTNSDIAQSQNLRVSGTSATSFNISVTPGRRLFWTIRANDGQTTSFPASGPFRFDVQTNTQNNVNTILTVTDTNGNSITSFNQTTTVRAQLRITNNTGTAQTLNFPTQQQYRFRVVNNANNTIVRNSDFNVNFGQNPSQLTIQPGQTQIFTYDWDQRDNNGLLVPAGTYRIEGELTTNPVTITSPIVVTLGNGTNPVNSAPVFTSFLPSNGTNFTSANNITLSWSATDADNNPLSYALYLTSQPVGQAAPSLATVMQAANQVNIANTATQYSFTPTLGQQYFWVVTVTDNIIATPVVGGTMPFTFTINQNAPANNAPVATLLTPGAAATSPAVNLTTTGSTTLQWTGTDADTADVPNLMYRVYVLDVPLTDTTTYTTAQIAQQANLRTTTNLTSTTYTTSDQRRIWWTVDVTDLRVTNSLPAFNGPFTFTVNSSGTVNPGNLVPNLVVSATPGGQNSQQTFNQLEMSYIHLALTNTSSTPQVLTFPNGNQVQVDVRDASNNVIFTQTLSGATSITVPANGVYNFPAIAWNGANSTTGARNTGTYTANATLLASGLSLTIPSQTFTLTTVATGGGSGGGGGGGGGSGVGSGGGGTSVDIASALNLPTTDTGARTWYGPVNFASSNGQVNIDLTHTDYATGFCAKWSKDTIVTTQNGQRFIGSYAPIQRFESDHVDSVIRSRLPQGANMLYPMYMQYGNLNELYSKPVTICGTLPEDIRAKATNANNIAILGYDPQAGQWVRLGSLANIPDGKTFSFAINKSMIIGFFEVGGSVIPGGDNGQTNPTDPQADDTFCRNFGSPFTDTKGHWADYYVCRLYRRGIVTGYLEGTLKGLFGPDRSITRAELTKILVQMNGISVTGATGNGGFRDVTGNEWFAPYVVAAKQAGIVDGYDDGYFRPFRNINRAEALKVILLSSGLATKGSVDAQQLSERADADNFAGFRDIPEDQWFSGYISLGRSLGIVSGSDGLFHAGNELTRAEMAKIAFFVLELKDAK